MKGSKYFLIKNNASQYPKVMSGLKVGLQIERNVKFATIKYVEHEEDEGIKILF